jgi:hypothetical protein
MTNALFVFITIAATVVYYYFEFLILGINIAQQDIVPS